MTGGAGTLTVSDILNRPVAPSEHRLPYGSDPLEFGDLRLPAGPGPHPVAIVLHGGCWLADYNLDYISGFAAALARSGIASWSLEYRRIGNPGGGWPGTFEDVARGADYLRDIAPHYGLDPNRVVAVGHSAGGHLALWLAARRRLPKESALYSDHPLALRGVVSLAGIPDLRRAVAENICGDAASRLLGGTPAEVAERYAQAAPSELLPLGVPQRVIIGSRDTIVPPALGRDYQAAASRVGDDARVIALTSAGHFELIAPDSAAWPPVRDAVVSLLGRNP